MAIPIQKCKILSGLINYGNSSETVGLTAYNGNHTAGSLTAIKVGTSPYSQTFTIPWDTFGVPAGNYTITARLFSSTDEVPSNNNFTDGTIRILPAPTLTVTPDTGPIGTTVRLQGSGFPDYYYSSQFQIEVTFDDQLVGLAQTKEGQFSFTFNIPLAQPGTHTIKALDTSTAKATASFLLKQNAPIPRIDVEAKGGTIYFPGDTAIIFVQTKINGQPVSVSNLQVTLMRPNGQITNLTAFLVAPGEWKATFAVPTTGSIGTYGVTVKAQQSGSIDGSSIVSFEVKPTWLQAHGPTVLGATAALGALGVLTFAWRKKYWTRRKGEPPF